MSMRKKLGLMMVVGAAGCGFFAYHLAGGTSGSFDPRMLLSQNDASALTATAGACLLMSWLALFGGDKNKKRRTA